MQPGTERALFPSGGKSTKLRNQDFVITVLMTLKLSHGSGPGKH